MRANEFLTELFDKHYYKIVWDERSPFEWEGHFEVEDGTGVTLSFRLTDNEGWMVEWTREGSVDRIPTSVKITNKILGTVKAALALLIKNMGPWVIYVGVTPTDSKKANIYKNMLGGMGYDWELMTPEDRSEIDLNPDYTWWAFYAHDELDEMALPTDWDPAALGHDKTFKSRLEYALQRATRLGGGSSRVAFVIPDQGRETVLKIAKNRKGLAQNQAEVDILDDGYLGRLDIVIPLVDYDKTRREPVWIQTEKANKISNTKLAKLLHAGGRWPMTNFTYAVHAVLGTTGKWMSSLEDIKKDMLNTGSTEQDIDIFLEYVNDVASLVSSSSLLIDDLGSARNWGEYQGRPVIIDLGFTESVRPMYIKARQ